MALHILKLAVGIDNVGHLRDVQARRRRELGRLCHFTRFTPKRAEEILEGGSLYWVVRHYIRVRQRVLDIETIKDANTGRERCALVLDPTLVHVVPVRRRPHQGWRYLEASSAPPDLDLPAETDHDIPIEMAAELRALGLI